MVGTWKSYIFIFRHYHGCPNVVLVSRMAVYYWLKADHVDRASRVTVSGHHPA